MTAPWHSRWDSLCERIKDAAGTLEDITEGADLDEIEVAVTALEERIEASEAAMDDDEDDDDEKDEETDDEDEDDDE